MKLRFFPILLITVFLMSGSAVFAAPHFTFTPSTGSYAVGSNFSVNLGVNSESENVGGADIVGTFDASRLEIVSITKASGEHSFSFEYNSSSTPIINNGAGSFEITLNPTSSSVYDYKPANEALLTINFKAKATGTANVNLTCQQGSVSDTNIINDKAADVVSCSSNQSGSYNITGGGSNPTSVPTPTKTTTTTTTQLPRTGGIGSTVGLVVFGAFSVFGALFLTLL